MKYVKAEAEVVKFDIADVLSTKKSCTNGTNPGSGGNQGCLGGAGAGGGH